MHDRLVQTVAIARQALEQEAVLRQSDTGIEFQKKNTAEPEGTRASYGSPRIEKEVDQNKNT